MTPFRVRHAHAHAQTHAQTHEPSVAIIFPFIVHDIELPALYPMLSMLLLLHHTPSHARITCYALLLLSISYILLPQLYTSLESMLACLACVLCVLHTVTYVATRASKKSASKQD